MKAYSDIITYVRSGPDEGQAAAIKEGLSDLSGDILGWLNADDYYFPGALDKAARCLERFPDVDVVYGDAIHVSQEGFFLFYFPPIQEFNRKDLTRSCFICQPACFVRRSAYEAVGGINTILTYTMDWDLWHRLSLKGARFFYLREPLAAVRYYPGTKTLSGSWKRYAEIWRIERRYGRRLLPLTWPGFYRYDLSCKRERSAPEQVLLGMLDGLRMGKKRLLRRRDNGKGPVGPIRGFQRWEPVVEGRGTILMPWYGPREWDGLRLRVEPLGSDYVIEINGQRCRWGVSMEGLLTVDVPENLGVKREITISRRDVERWKLHEFFCHLRPEAKVSPT